MLLAIDTATHRASIALHDGDALRGECTWEAANRHTVTLLPHIVEMLEETGITAADLSALAVCIGPGSYTGVRIGVAVAKGLATAHALPMVGMTTLEILVAAQPPDPRPLYALFGAGRRRVGYARFRWHQSAWQVETEVTLATWSEFSEVLSATGDAALVMGEIGAKGRAALAALGDAVEIPSPARHLRRAGFLADLAWARLREGEQGDAAQVNPVYAR